MGIKSTISHAALLAALLATMFSTTVAANIDPYAGQARDGLYRLGSGAAISNIDVIVADGVATINGTVANTAERYLARRLLAADSGISHVIDITPLSN